MEKVDATDLGEDAVKYSLGGFSSQSGGDGGVEGVRLGVERCARRVGAFDGTAKDAERNNDVVRGIGSAEVEAGAVRHGRRR